MDAEAETIVITPAWNERGIAAHVYDVFQAVPEASVRIVGDDSDDGTR
ncbi:MAG TPA: hypothetical protein VNC59_06305 [Thermoanaerobaculia bacterium]|nr:hypothetical protein [Thermoanaerobaculia bacterium]